MHKYNHPQIKTKKYFQPFQWLVEKHANSGHFNVLKTVSRLIGLLVCSFVSLISEPNILYVLITVILMDAIFLLAGLKESTYKAPLFFKDNKITPKSLDRYTMILALLKLFLFVPMALAGPSFFFVFLGLYFPAPWVVAYFTNYKPYIPDGSVPDNKPWYYGIPGFGMAGNYTGEPGSIGGQSG